MVTLQQYWPELDSITFEKWDAINVYSEVHIITVHQT